MSIVFIDEAGGSLRECGTQSTAERYGIAWVDIDTSVLNHEPHLYTLVEGVPTLLEDAAFAEDVGVIEEAYRGDLQKLRNGSAQEEVDTFHPKIAAAEAYQHGTATDYQNYYLGINEKAVGGLVIIDDSPTVISPLNPE